VDRGAAAASLAFERSTAAVAFDVHLEDGGVMNEAVDDGDRHCLVWEDFAPFAKRLVGGNQQGSSLVAGADELKEHAGFGLVFGDVGEVIEDQQVVFIELDNGSFESELAAGDLQPLDEIGGPSKQDAPAVFDKREAKSCREMALAPAGQLNDTLRSITGSTSRSITGITRGWGARSWSSSVIIMVASFTM
jgi:hypothetical protein